MRHPATPCVLTFLAVAAILMLVRPKFVQDRTDTPPSEAGPCSARRVVVWAALAALGVALIPWVTAHWAKIASVAGGLRAKLSPAN